jgi:hypothetical protein
VWWGEVSLAVGAGGYQARCGWAEDVGKDLVREAAVGGTATNVLTVMKAHAVVCAADADPGIVFSTKSLVAHPLDVEACQEQDLNGVVWFQGSCAHQRSVDLYLLGPLARHHHQGGGVG